MNLTKKQIIQDMKSTEQMKNLSVLEHGVSVAHYFRDLYNHINHNSPLQYEWKLPEWIFDKDLWEFNNLNLKDVYKYHIYHDCGKPYCLEFDEQGRRHFPDHANISYQVAQNFLNEDIAMLIRNDMEAHLTKPSEFKNFMALDNYTILLLTAMSEIHSNAVMFGGIESQSFKIKHKKLTRLGKNVLKEIKRTK